MGYVEKILGDNERVVYSTHQHLVVLLGQLLGSLFAFLVFLGLGLAVLIPPTDEAGNQVRFIVGVIALCSLVLPLYLIVSAWLQGLRGRDLVRRIWRAVLAGILILAFALIMMFYAEFWPIGLVAIAVAIVPAVELTRIFLDWLNERYIITNRRVMEMRGIINKHVRDSALEKVNDVELDQSFVGRLLGYGTVQIITGSDIGMNMFHRISNPVRFKRAMLNAKEGLQTTRSEDTIPLGPVVQAAQSGVAETQPAAAANIPDMLVELDELRQKGIISEEEFQAKKRELLDRL
jgi:hypothetical protein